MMPIAYPSQSTHFYCQNRLVRVVFCPHSQYLCFCEHETLRNSRAQAAITCRVDTNRRKMSLLLDVYRENLIQIPIDQKPAATANQIPRGFLP